MDYVNLIAVAANYGVAIVYSIILLRYVLKRLTQAFDEIVATLKSLNSEMQKIKEQVRKETEIEQLLVLELLRRREGASLAAKADKV